MRAVVVSSLIVLVACGGSKKPAESATESTSTETSASSGTDMPASSDTASADASASSALGASSAPETPPPAEPAPTHPVPNTTGAIDGKPFAPKMARVTQAAQKDGRIVLTLDERTECGGGDPKPGEALLTLTVPWEDGYKQDLGSLKRGKKGSEIGFVRVSTNGKKDASATFKPSGRVTVVKAPSEEGALGKINIDMQSGEYMLSGDLDVQICVAPKGASAAAAAKPEKADKPDKPEKPKKKKK
jgi:hypothetical protein